MNEIWHLLRMFYLLGLLPVVLFFLFFAFHYDSEVGAAVLICSLGYFLIGYFLLKTFPNFLRSRVHARVANFKAKGFAPQFEVESWIHNSYMGFDPKMRKVLYVDTSGHGIQTLIDFDDVNRWKLEGKSPVVLTLLTNLPACPVLKLGIYDLKTDECMAHLVMFFG
ncbi:hypothetical protein XFHB_13220 (plasmid) [Xylella fastidiosa]|uniref:Uncharacterized protein n=1 Tax=Xylella fastidiosa TaxID=2371 RepID=A0ABC8AH26_XYLFS|nr:hypothetical protein [Xylella fastidiosa]ALR07889.1 hypothetical protein XFHB_13220 [Xylella fastidiosa]